MIADDVKFLVRNAIEHYKKYLVAAGEPVPDIAFKETAASITVTVRTSKADAHEDEVEDDHTES